MFELPVCRRCRWACILKPTIRVNLGFQSFDLTERECIPALWIACHDDDAQNANLARQLWVGNALDVPEDVVSQLMPFLGK